MFNRTALEGIRNYLLRSKQTVAVAESVTSGFLQAAFSTVPDAAKFFHGGITAYNLGQKYRHLQVNPIHAENCNCVSDEVAAAMALNVCGLFESQWGIAITGYATRVPEGNHELHAFYAFACKGNIVLADALKASTEEGIDAQFYFVNEVLAALYEHTRKDTEKTV